MAQTVCRPHFTTEVQFQPQASGGQIGTEKGLFKYVSFLWQYHLTDVHSSVTTFLSNTLKN